MIFFILVASLASLVYYSQRKTILREKSNELSALFRLKERQLLDWKHERESDAMLIKLNPDRINLFEDILNSPNDSTLINYFNHFACSRIKTWHYSSIVLADNKGIPIVCCTDSTKSDYVSVPYKEDIESVTNKDSIFLTNLHFTPDSQIILHMIIPLSHSTRQKNKCDGFLIINIDPMVEFYPLLQTLQTHSKSTEVLIVKAENGQLVMLNELRYTKHSALRMKFSINTGNLAAARAVRGETGIMEAVDYRNKKVLAAVGPVSGTSWFLVVKTDTSEIYAELRKFAIHTLIICILLLVTGYLSIRIIWIQRNAMDEKEHMQLEHNYELFKYKYNLVSKYANDAILLWDKNLKLTDVNDKALELYEFTFTEMIGISKASLRPKEIRHELDKIIRSLNEKSGIRYETRHVRKDGTIFPVEVSTSHFLVDNQSYYQSIVRDITERKKTENIIRENEIKFQNLFENIDTCVAVYEAIDNGSDFIIKDFNKAAEKIEKVSKNSIKGKRVTHVFPGIISFGLLEVFQRVWKTGIAEEFPAKIYHDTKITGWRENYVYRLPSEEIVAVYRDVTEEKDLLNHLRENEERLRLALKAAKQGLYDLNIQSGEAIVSPEYEIMLGYEPGELQETNRKWQNRLHPDDRDAAYKAYNDYINGLTDEYRIEFRQKTKSGDWLWILSTGEIVSYDDLGKPLRMLGFHTNIHDIKIIELELKKKELMLTEMGKVGKIGGWEFDAETLQGSWTEEVAKIHELDPNDKTNMELGMTFYHGESREKIEQAIQDAITNGIPYNLELELITRNGNHKWVKSIGIPEIKNGKVVKVSGSFQDITEMKLATDKLAQERILLRTLIDNLPDNVYVKDTNMRKILVNKAIKSRKT